MSKDPQQVHLPNPKAFNVQLSDCWQALQGGTTIAVYKSLIELTGKIKTAVFLSQILYWTRVGTNVSSNEGWFFKSIEQMYQETGLTKREQQRCKEYLLEVGLIETKREGMNNKLFIRIVFGELAKQLGHNNNGSSESIQLSDLQNQRSLFFRKFFSERIAYHRDLVTLTGCIHSAIMLSYMLRVAVRNAQGNVVQHGFASFKIHEWKLLLALSYRNQLTVRNRLKDLQYIVERHFYSSRRIFTLVNGRAIVNDLKKQIGKVRPTQEAIEPGTLEPLKDDSWQVWASSVGRFGHLPKNEVTKREIREEPNEKLGSDNTANKGITKRQIVNNNFTYIENYNYKTWPSIFSKPLRNFECNVVVFEDLIFPKVIKGALVQKTFGLLMNQLNSPSQSLLQDILDEIAGQRKAIHSPLGLLTMLIRLANKNELICVMAPMVQQQRAKAEAVRRILAANSEVTTNATPCQPKAVSNKNTEIRQRVFENIYKVLKDK